MQTAFDHNAVKIKLARLRSAADSAGRAGQSADHEVASLVQSRRELESEIRLHAEHLGYAKAIYSPDGKATVAAAEAKLVEISATADALNSAITESRDRATTARAAYQRHAGLLTRALRVAEQLHVGAI
ncbi:MAG: hypothetical protein JNM37_14160 [Rhodocyclaceae bacterium]|nr:hypothetical protein [Rhodocyclaceae bacterium]